MNDLKNHVDKMFSRYKENDKIKELKYEVLSNLEAKVNDLIDNGMEYDEAVKKAKESMTSIDYLIDDNIKVYINKFKIEYVQISLLYLIIAWILTIPIGIIGAGILLNKLLLICSIGIGIWYISLNRKKELEYYKNKAFLNIKSAYKFRKIAWIIYSLYIIFSILSITAIHFGSNIWFSRPIKISGPYQFAEIIVKYALPLIYIIIPLIFNMAPKLISKYEVGEEDNEDKE